MPHPIFGVIAGAGGNRMPPVGHPPSPDHAGRIDQRRIEIKSFKNRGWVGGRSGRRGSIVDQRWRGRIRAFHLCR